MSNEAGPDQPKPQDPQQTPDLPIPQPDPADLRDQELRTAIQEHAHNKPGPKPKENETITIQTEGRVVGRDKRPVPSADVFKLAAIGCKDNEIADWFGIDSNTLRYNFSTELTKGRESLKHSLRKKQIDVAMSGNATMLIFLGKNLLGQSDNPISSQEHTVLPWTDE